ncbi:M20/M25/M40 family metallo-hydrolase [Cryobacterium sp. TMT3-29-2]|nr:M20/M25/M40 family metallo-hydrolase [Cryobacterium sp. TMT3-29-2]
MRRSRPVFNRGFEVHRLEERPGRPTIVGIRRGTGGGRSLILNGHLDTVGVVGYAGDPFSGELRDGRVLGRGAFDMKGGVAAILVAAARATGASGAGASVLAGSVAGFRFRLTRLVTRAAFEADPEWPIVRTLSAHAAAVLGRRPDVRGEPFWTDAGLLHEAGIPCLVVGVDGGGAHADAEWADAASVDALTEILTRTIVDFCA